jgi:hypothetical protein
VEYKPDVVVILGDLWDLPSLSSYDAPGSIRLEGARIAEDIEAGNEAFQRLVGPMQKEVKRQKARKLKQRWTPDLHFLMGNHENRIERTVAGNAKYEGVLSTDDLKTPGFKRSGFLEIVELDGVSYSHYFSNLGSGKPIGGSIDARLNKIGRTFVQGHQQGFLYGCREYPGSVRRHGLVAGSFYQHAEEYRGAQGTSEWRGIVVLNEVANGDFCIMPLTMDYLRKRYSVR